jgi:dethiobiotin synthetase
MQNVFITGTDTGVGKTVVSAALLALAREKGVDAVPFKAVQTGCRGRGSTLRAPDLEFSIRMSGMDVSTVERKRMAPYRYRPACSPHLAAQKAGDAIMLSDIRKHCRILAQAHDAVIAEGAGGVLVPIGGSRTMLDVMKSLGFPVILVSRPELGTLNHTLMSLKVLRDAGLEVLAVVLCRTQSEGTSYIESDNRKTLNKLGKLPVLGPVPFIRAIQTEKISPQTFLSKLKPSINPLLALLDPNYQ